MAEFALGLTKTAVEGTVNRVKSAMDEEAKLKVRVQNDLVFITGEFQMMQSFLNVANKERAKNEVVRTWVRQIRDLAFDVEDCVELVVSLDIKSGWSWLWRVLPGCMAPPRPLDQAVAEIQRLKERVEDVSHRNTRYNLISDSGSNSMSTAVNAVSSSESEHKLSATTDAGASSSAFHTLREVWEAGKKLRHDMADLKKLLTNEGSDLEVISLWRSPGFTADLGTASIVRKVYNDPIICQGFKSRAWVKLRHPFNLDEFLKSLFTQLYAASSHQQANIEPFFPTTEEYHHLIKTELMQKVSQQRYLIFVEELSTVVEWNAIRMYLPDSKNGSRIVVTTQQLGLALSCTGDPYQVSELRKFFDGQSLCAFFNKKGYSDENKSPDTSSESKSETEEQRGQITELELIGRQGEQEMLRNRLRRDGCVTSVWGVAGVGKSALVRNIYYHDMTNCVDQLTKYSWVDVPQSFNLTDFSKRLLIDFYSVDLEAKETAIINMMEGQDPIQLCCEILQENKCFVVIDGLRSTDDWDMIRAAFLAKPISGHIFVITNDESIAMHCIDDSHEGIINVTSPLNVTGLEDDEALNLFTKLTRWDMAGLTFNEVELSKRIITKCGGLPSVITSIAKYNHDIWWSTHMRVLRAFFRNQEKRSLLERTCDEFMRLLETNPVCRSSGSGGLLSWMQSYFHDCPDSLKPCIFYLSIFPPSHSIRRRRLLRRWIAEGYCTEENGEKYFSNLVKLSIIQQQPPSKEDVCQFNGFFREYIISRPMQDNLVFELEGHCSLDSQRAGQHLTISTSWDRAKILFESLELSRLRSFTVFGEWMSFFISTSANMRLLRVLDLEDTSGLTDADLKQIGKQIPRLKFLSLRGCKEITCLPNSLGDLRQLQTLDIKGTSIVTLPRAIMKLEKLQYVRAGSTHCISTPSEDNNGTILRAPPADGDGASTSQAPVEASDVATPPPTNVDGTCTSQIPATTTADKAQTSTPWISGLRGCLVFRSSSKLQRNGLVSSTHGGVQLPASAVGGIGKLRSLHTLGVLNVEGASGNVVLRELKRLAQLRKLKLLGISRRNWQDFCFAISGHAYLESLSVRLSDGQQDHMYWLDDISKPPKTLKSLKLYGGNVHVSPVWMKQLEGLTKGDFADVELTVSRQDEIDSLMELQHQDMYHRIGVKPIQDGKLCYGGKNWWDQLKAAKILKIDCGSYKSEIVFGSLMPQFEVLVVHCSTTGESLELSGVDKYLPNLKEVWLKGTYSESVKQHLQDEAAKHPKKPVVKLQDQHRMS